MISIVQFRMSCKLFFFYLETGSPKLSQDVKAVPADTTQPVVGNLAQHLASQQAVATETPQEQAYIALLQQQQEEQMRHIRELETRLQRQHQMSQQEQEGESQFQLPNEVFAQIQALTGMVNQPGTASPGGYGSEQYPGGGENYQAEYGQQYGQEKYQQMADQNYQQQVSWRKKRT